MELFSFEGDRGEPQTWFLGRRNRRPHRRPIDQVGFFEFDGAREIDNYIAGAQRGLESVVSSVVGGREPASGDWDAIIDYVAVHFVRSQARAVQIQLELNRLLADSAITPTQAQDQFDRLRTNRDVDLFRRLVECAAASFSQCLSVMVVASGQRGFITSEKVIHTTFDPDEVGRVANHQVWMPFAPSVGMLLRADGPADPILRLAPGRAGALEVSGLPRAPQIKGAPKPLEMDDAQADALNGLMLAGARRLFATDPQDIDAAIRFATGRYGIQSPFRYRPASAG